MRRLLAILLLAAFSLPAVAPLLAQDAETATNLPICCRRNGAHHCAMREANRSGTPAISARCPSFPQPSVTASHLQLADFQPTALPLKLPVTSPTAASRAETQRRLSRERTRHKRGPPAATLAA